MMLHFLHLSLCFLFFAIDQAAGNATLLHDAAELLKEYDLPPNGLGATAFALIYGTPLEAFIKEFGGAKGLVGLGTNSMRTSANLSTAASQNVVLPNVDTLYALAVLDLSRNDVVFHLPRMESDRCYLVGFWDPYGGQYSSIGSIEGSDPGDYLVRPSLYTGSYGLKSCEGYAGCIDAPTVYGTFLVRVEVKNNSTDLEYVREWIGRSSIVPGNKHTFKFPLLSPTLFSDLSNDTTTRTLQLLARLGEPNPPWDPSLAAPLRGVMELAGISEGHYRKPRGVDLRTANALFEERYRHPKQPYLQIANNGWSNNNLSEQGTYLDGTAFLTRTYISINEYLANTPNDALYLKPINSTLRLKRDESFILEFSGKPPVGDNGFWSVTAYDSAGYLIANSLNKYAVGDRSNITYPDGTLVYPEYLNSTYNSSSINGPFEVLLQSAEFPPPSNWTNNWLPVPADNATFTILLRLYDPTYSLENGEYQYPIVSRRAAIS